MSTLNKIELVLGGGIQGEVSFVDIYLVKEVCSSSF